VRGRCNTSTLPLMCAAVIISNQIRNEFFFTFVRFVTAFRCHRVAIDKSRADVECILLPYGLVQIRASCNVASGSLGGPNERRLLLDLGLNDTNIYNKLERPVVNESDALTVQFGLVLQQIIGVVSIRCDFRQCERFVSRIGSNPRLRRYS
jgi:hypothetical protein